MATGKITKRSVDALQPGGTTDFLWDDELRGFGVRITSNGAKSYVFQYRLGGREAQKRRATIGRHGSPWTPQTAREEAGRLARMVGQGQDPMQLDADRRRQSVDLAFDAYVTRFVDGHLKAAWKNWRIGERLLVSEAVPVLKSKALPQIKRADLSAVIDRLADRPGAARLAHATLRKLFKWAESRGDIERSPMEAMQAPKSVAARDRVLSDQELEAVWDAAGHLDYPFGPLFRLLIVTGQRREEVAALNWSELDRGNAVWTLPATRAKNGKAHIVPLSALALAELDKLATALGYDAADNPRWPAHGLLFTTTGKTAVSGYSKAKTRLDRLAAISDDWRTHDLRRTVATGFQRLGIRYEVTEAVLNHVSGARSGVAGVYQRHDWKGEKRAALESWGRHISRLGKRAPQTVVTIAPRKAVA